MGRRLLQRFGSSEALTFIYTANAKYRSYSRFATPCILHLHGLALSVHQLSFQRQKCGCCNFSYFSFLVSIQANLIFYFYGLMCICFSELLRFLTDFRWFEGWGGGFYGDSVHLMRLLSLTPQMQNAGVIPALLLRAFCICMG